MRHLLTAFLIGLAAAGAPAAAAPAAAAPTRPDPAAAPDPVVLARMQDVARAGRFAEAYKRGLRASPASPLRDKVLALDDAILGDVFARTLARRFDVAEATAIAAFYASADGEALTAAQLSAPDAPAPAMPAERRARIEAFFASDAGRKFNATLSDKAMLDELQLALAFIAGGPAR